MKNRMFNNGRKEIFDDLDLFTERRVNHDHKRIKVWLAERPQAKL